MSDPVKPSLEAYITSLPFEGHPLTRWLCAVAKEISEDSPEDARCDLDDDLHRQILAGARADIEKARAMRTLEIFSEMLDARGDTK